MDVVTAALLVLAAGVSPAMAQASPLGAVGESCRARADCQAGLRCVGQVCRSAVDEICVREADCGAGQTCRHGRCEAAPRSSATRRRVSWRDFRLSGAHFFTGFTLAPGMTGGWLYGGPVNVEPAFFFALRAGMLFDRTELMLEIAPQSWLWDFEPKRSSFSLNVSIGGLQRVARRAYWPIRFGLGFTAGNLEYEKIYMQGRLDLIGLAIQFGHLLFEISLPSTRFHTEFKTQGIWAWLFNCSVSYVL